MRFPRDAPKRKIVRTLETIGFNLQRFANTFYKEKTRADVEKFYLDTLNG